MRRREEKRRKLHEALLQTLYPPSSPSSPSSSPSPPADVIDDGLFDVTLINPEDYMKSDSSNDGDDNEIGDKSEITEKPSRAQRKRLRKKMLKEEASRRRKVIGPLLPVQMIKTRDTSVADADGSSSGKESDGEEEGSCLQPVRLNAPEKEEKFGGDDKTKKVKKRREAKKVKKLAKESSKPFHLQDPST